MLQPNVPNLKPLSAAKSSRQLSSKISLLLYTDNATHISVSGSDAYLSKHVDEVQSFFKSMSDLKGERVSHCRRNRAASQLV